MKIITNKDLTDYNTMGVKASCDYFISFQNTHDITEIIQWRKDHSEPYLILGGGSNILFTTPYKGIVIHPIAKGRKLVKETHNDFYIEAKAGENWHEFVLWCIKRGYAGLENLSLIPGSVGAAPVQNIGAYGVEIKDFISHITAYDLNTGQLITLDNKACQFSYRNSLFKTGAGKHYLLASITVKLPKKPHWKLHYKGLKEALGDGPINSHTISQAIIHIRQNKLPSPNVIGNCGSFFKNPIIPFSQWQQLQQKYNDIPSFPLANKQTSHSVDEVKTSAAWLIEQSHWKGKKEGQAGIYEKHALVLVNYGEATGDNIWTLAQKIIDSVKRRFGIQLEPEVNIL